MDIQERTILIVGTGSIGRRHLKNLQTLGINKFVLYRTGRSTLPDKQILDIPQEYDLEKALSYKPIATIIANPSALHISIALEAAQTGSHLFIEKPLSHNLDHIKKLQQIVREHRLIVQVGFQFRFHSELLKIKQRLDKKEIGEIVSVQAHYGEFLPDWHPWEDYRKSYAAKKELGGGVLLTLCHPLDYLRWLFGDIESVCAFQNRSNQLEIDVEDTADVLLHFKSGIAGNVHLNYWQKPAEHYIRIVGKDGIMHLNLIQSKEDRNSMFVDEMKHFLSRIKTNRAPFCSLNDGIEALKIVLAAKLSAEKKRLIKI